MFKQPPRAAISALAILAKPFTQNDKILPRLIRDTAGPRPFRARLRATVLAAGLFAVTMAAHPLSAQDAETPPPQASEPGETAGQTQDDKELLPEVVIETDAEAEAAVETAAPETDDKPSPPRQQANRPRPAAPPPSSPPQQTVEPVAASDTAAAGDGVDNIGGAPLGGLGTGTTGVDGYIAGGTSSATKTNTPIADIPQSISIVTEKQAADQGSNTVGEALLFVPGVTVQQGEGHRDQVTIRGQSTTADFFTDGVRDDIQYYRDLYNIETIEVLKGPNAMTFGRGGGGGVINRVTKKADWTNVREATFQTGMYSRARTTMDVGQAVTDGFAVRFNGMYENSESFRDYFELERYGINPKVAFRPSRNTTLHLSYEYYRDDRTVDRGVPSFMGAPFDTARDIFFGNPDASYSDFTAHVLTATFEHRTDFGLNFRNHTSYADYDKVYSNIMAVGPVTGGTYPIGGYVNATDRQSFFNQTDVSYRFQVNDHIRHTFLTGVEVGRQDQFNSRNTPTFAASGTGTLIVPVANPTNFSSVVFDVAARRRFADLKTASFYIQDQLEITKYFEIIAGLRFERFDLDFLNGLNGDRFARVDDVWSPRIGAVFKPFDGLSLYASYAKSFLPSAGDQFDNLNLATANLEPEEFQNREFGFKWEVAPRLWLTGALYELARTNQVISTGPLSATQAGETLTRGGEIALTGYVTDDWQIVAGYGNQNAKVTIGNPGDIGKTVPSVPRHTFSLWNRYQLSPFFGAGLGVIHQASFFAELDNDVKVASYTRVDAALFFDISENWSAQVNIENLFDEDYFASAHNNDNISPGSPRAAYVTVRAKF